jgi:hypothetical protein
MLSGRDLQSGLANKVNLKIVRNNQDKFYQNILKFQNIFTIFNK